ncbi:MAG: hypothetical protein RIT81_24930 [Deltaproteobacteria bacterium]
MWARFVAFVARPWTGGRTRRLATLRMRADAAGEDARELVRVAEAFRDEAQPQLASRTFWRAVHVYRRRDEHTKGLAVLKRIVALAPNEPSARTAIGECLERLERRAEAADHFRHAALLAAQAQRPNAAKQLYARADRLCPRGPRKIARGASVLAEDLQLPTEAQPSLRDDRVPAAQVNGGRGPDAQPNDGQGGPAAHPSQRDDRAPAARDRHTPVAQSNLRDDHAHAAHARLRHDRTPAAPANHGHRAAAVQPSLRDDRVPAAKVNRGRAAAAQPSLRDDRVTATQADHGRAAAAQPSLRDDRVPATQANGGRRATPARRSHGQRAPAAQPIQGDGRARAAPADRGHRAPAAHPSLRDDRAPAANPGLRDDHATAAQPSLRVDRARAAQVDGGHRAGVQPSLRDDRAPAAAPSPAPRSAPVAPPTSRAPVARTPEVVPPATPPPAPRRVVTTARDASAPELPDVARWPSIPGPRAATPRLEYAAPDPVVARPRRRAEALFQAEETAAVQGTGTELALDAEALLLDDDPAEAATAKTAPRSPLDAVQEPVVFDAPTTNYAPMMLDDLLQSEEETVTTVPIDPLRCAS